MAASWKPWKTSRDPDVVRLKRLNFRQQLHAKGKKCEALARGFLWFNLCIAGIALINIEITIRNISRCVLLLAWLLCATRRRINLKIIEAIASLK